MPLFLTRKLVVTVQECESNCHVAVQDFMGRMSGMCKMEFDMGRKVKKDN